MATIYRCDRCKKEFTNENHVTDVTILKPAFAYKDLGFTEQATTYDLCKACVEHIIKEITDVRDLAT